MIQTAIANGGFRGILRGMSSASDSDANQRIYIVGAGSIALTHAAAVGQLPGGVELHVADPNAGALDAFCDRFVNAVRHASAAEMLATPARGSDIVVIATPPKWHAELTLMALGAGEGAKGVARNVLCEKPLAMSSAEVEMMLRAARASGKKLGCCSSRFIGSGTMARARRMIREGLLGAVYHVTWIHRENRSRTGVEYQPSTPWFVNKAVSGGGCLMDWGPYDMSALCYLLDPFRVEVVSAWTSAPETHLSLPPGTVYDIETHVGAALRFHCRTSEGGVAKVNVTYERASCTHGHEVKVNEVEGSAGAIRWEWTHWNGSPPVRLAHDAEGKIAMVEHEVEEDDGLTPHERPLVHLYKEVRGQANDGVHDEQAVFNFSILRAIYESALVGGPIAVTKASA